MAHAEGIRFTVGRLDDLARRDTPAGRLDPRLKVIATLAFIGVVASFGRLELARLAPLALFPLALFTLGDVPVRPLLFRLAVASPFALGMGLPEPFLDHAPALLLGSFCMTRGSLACLTILAKFGLSLGAALLLVATTRFDEVCVALGRMGVPRPLVRQLLLTYRYLFVLGEEAARLVRAHALRSPDHPRPTLRIAGVLLGQLLLRAVGRGERIHVAMGCRGFDGSMPMRREWSLGKGDAAFALFTVALLVGTRAMDLSLLLGRTIMGGSP